MQGHSCRTLPGLAHANCQHSYGRSVTTREFIQFSLIKVQKSPTALLRSLAFPNELASGQAWLTDVVFQAKANAQKAQPRHTHSVPFQLQPQDPATKPPAKLVHRIENLEFLEIALKRGYQSPL